MVEFLLIAAFASAAVGFMASDTGDSAPANDDALPPNSDDAPENLGSNFSPTSDQPVEHNLKDETSGVLPGSKAGVFVENSNPGGTVFWSGNEHLYSPGREGSDLEIIEGSSEMENFLVNSGSAIIQTGGGGDFVDARGMESGIIIAESGDTIAGSDIADSTGKLGVEIRGAGVFLGGNAGESIVAAGDGAEINGGGGNDKILSVDGSAVLNGGDGDDYIDGAATVSEYSQDTRAISISNDAHSDLIDGGAGDDRIYLSNGDIAKGGTGDDFFAAEFNFHTSLKVIEISDFDPVSETLLLQIETENSGDLDDDLFFLRDRIQTEETDGDTYISVDGVTVVKLAGVTNLDLSGHEESDWPVKIRHYVDERD